jgi:hypothetical protein
VSTEKLAYAVMRNVQIGKSIIIILVVTIYKSSPKLNTNPNLVSSHMASPNLGLVKN